MWQKVSFRENPKRELRGGVAGNEILAKRGNDTKLTTDINLYAGGFSCEFALRQRAMGRLADTVTVLAQYFPICQQRAEELNAECVSEVLRKGWKYVKTPQYCNVSLIGLWCNVYCGKKVKSAFVKQWFNSEHYNQWKKTCHCLVVSVQQCRPYCFLAVCSQFSFLISSHEEKEMLPHVRLKTCCIFTNVLLGSPLTLAAPVTTKPVNVNVHFSPPLCCTLLLRKLNVSADLSFETIICPWRYWEAVPWHTLDHTWVLGVRVTVSSM